MDASQEKSSVPKRNANKGSWLNIFRCGSNKQTLDDELNKSSQETGRSFVAVPGENSRPVQTLSPEHVKRRTFLPRLRKASSNVDSRGSMPVRILEEYTKQNSHTITRSTDSNSLMPNASQLSKAAQVSPNRRFEQNGICADLPVRTEREEGCTDQLTSQSTTQPANVFERKAPPSRVILKFDGTVVTSSASNRLETRTIPASHTSNTCSANPHLAFGQGRANESYGLRGFLQNLVGSSVAQSVSSASTVSAVDVKEFPTSSPYVGSSARPSLISPSDRIVGNMEEAGEMKLPLEGEVVWLNIYDVKQTFQLVNDLAKQVGSGAFHAGVEVYGQEWSFGWKEFGSGVYCSAPMSNDRHKYRESVAMGATILRSDEISTLIHKLRQVWIGKDYQLLTWNCCHFADAMCRDLGVGPVPEWLMHLASAGTSFVEGVDQAVSRAQEAAELAVSKAAEFDERFQISRNFDSFLQREIDIDQTHLEEAARGLFSKAMEKLDSVGTMAGQVLNDVDGARRRLSARDIFAEPHDKDDEVFRNSAALSPTPARGRKKSGEGISSPANLQSLPVVGMPKADNANCDVDLDKMPDVTAAMQSAAMQSALAAARIEKSPEQCPEIQGERSTSEETPTSATRGANTLNEAVCQ